MLVRKRQRNMFVYREGVKLGHALLMTGGNTGKKKRLTQRFMES